MGSSCYSLRLRRRRRGTRLFVMLFVVIDLFIAAFTACLCGWLIRSARHGTADNDDGHGDDATCFCVFGGVCWAALADVRLGARRRCVHVYISPLGWRVFGCWTVCPEPRVYVCWRRPMYWVVFLFVKIATAAAAALV
jgi:hypothetical protein